MIARAGSGWQTVLADLSLILFMVMASAVAQAPESADASPGAFAMAELVAVWRPSNAGPPLASWLAEQPADPRLRLTLVIHAGTGEEATTLAASLATAGSAARDARVVVDRDPGPPLEAFLAFDQNHSPARTPL